MLSTIAPLSIASDTFDRTISDLKQGVETATTAQAQASEKVIATAKTMMSFHQGTLEAFTEASQTLASGSKDLLRQMGESGQSAFEQSFSSIRALANAKSVKELIELQTGFVRSSANWAVSETSRFAQAGIELADKAFAPIAARAVAAAETMSSVQA